MKLYFHPASGNSRRVLLTAEHLQIPIELADYSLAPSFAAAVPAKMPIADYKHLQAWLGRVQALDAWTRTA